MQNCRLNKFSTILEIKVNHTYYRSIRTLTSFIRDTRYIAFENKRRLQNGKVNRDYIPS